MILALTHNELVFEQFWEGFDDDVKDCPFVDSRLDSDLPAKAFTDLLRDEQTKSTPIWISFATHLTIRAPVLFEDVRNFLFSHSNSFVLNDNIDYNFVVLFKVRHNIQIHIDYAVGLEFDRVWEDI